MTVVLAAAVENWVGLGLAVLLVAFLFVSLLFPERF
jgi:K+-transporting ATPase KdpF subunit